LRERSIDLLIGRIPAPFDEDDLDAEVVYNDDTVVIAGRHSKWAKSRKLKLADLAGERWILPPPDTMHGAGAPKVFRDSGSEMPPAPITILSIHLCLRLVAGAQFVTMLPASVLGFGNSSESLKVLPIRIPAGRRPVAIVTLKNRTRSPAAKLFIDASIERRERTRSALRVKG
jgi:DNA-binding transcriptional LysR family regulator